MPKNLDRPGRWAHFNVKLHFYLVNFISITYKFRTAIAALFKVVHVFRVALMETVENREIQIMGTLLDSRDKQVMTGSVRFC